MSQLDTLDRERYGVWRRLPDDSWEFIRSHRLLATAVIHARFVGGRVWVPGTTPEDAGGQS